MYFELIFFIIGLSLLYIGAECLIEGGISLAKKLLLSPMLIGLTVVAFGTSTPELIISIITIYRDKSMLAIGNIIGSNICNLTMVLGIAALIKPLITNKSVIKVDISVMLYSSIFLLLISIDSVISKLDGFVLSTGAIIYIYFNYNNSNYATKLSTFQNNLLSKSYSKKKIFVGYEIFTILLGIVALITGAEFIINAATKIMINLGISEKCIGLTIVAIGTSIPELATSLVAIKKKHIEILIGNIVGSNIFNILSVIGITSLIQPINIKVTFMQSGLIIDYIVMILANLLLILLVKNNKNITKIKGLILLLLYIGYIILLFLKE